MTNEFSAFLSAVEARDPDAIANCFSGDAVVWDVGRKIAGRDAIRSWARAEIVNECLKYTVQETRKTDDGYTFIIAISSPKFSFRARYDVTVADGAIVRAILEYA